MRFSMKKIGVISILPFLLFTSACGAGASVRGTDAASNSGNSDLCRGTTNQTLSTLDDFPAAYDYGTGRMEDVSSSEMYRKTPKPQNAEDTVLNTAADPDAFQALYLWENGNMPSSTVFTSDMTGY